ncbi:hypothetical protein CQA53_10005 [Helicobacter didelphidarum]|uniref:Uncharacterized protein n=1 Tax=Helicobacter didelphidarum TaxID=2040648 RepID=A0A3D8I8U4_9HELI|nr:hypothetical protein [Helicobacter didelphidarum]RDU61537.1 hypothetical protein CQA53_10005 [Helicobacter didelphidarum]
MDEIKIKTLEERIIEANDALVKQVEQFNNGEVTQINNTDTYAYIKKVYLDNISSLTKASPIALLKALYQCENYIALDSSNNPTLDDNNAIKNFGYKSSFYLSFIANRDSLSDEYLEARKALYKSIMQIKQERQSEIEQEQKRINNLSYEEYERELKELEREQRQARFSKKDKSKDSNHLILESNDKSIKIIFLDKLDSNQSSNVSSLREVGTTSWQSISTTQPNNLSLSNLLHLHNNKIDIFTKNGSEIDIAEIESLLRDYKDTYTDSKIASNPTLDSNDTFRDSNLTLDILNSPNTQIFLYSTLLHGSKEIESHPLYFGELDKEGELIESKPMYYLQGGEDIDSVIARNEMTKQSTNKDSKQSTNNNSTDSNAMNCHEANTSRNDKNISTSTLQIFLHSSTLTILHYSLIHSSLNIKLECNSSESQEIVKQERDCHEAKASRNDNKESLSTAFLCPILEDNELKCPHDGIVKLKSKKGKSFKSKDIPMILESDLLNASIINYNVKLIS